MNTGLDDKEQVATIASVSARVLADAQRSYGAEVDAAMLEQQVHEVVSLLWTESPKVTTFISLLASRDLRERLVNLPDAPQA